MKVTLAIFFALILIRKGQGCQFPATVKSRDLSQAPSRNYCYLDSCKKEKRTNDMSLIFNVTE